MEELVATYKRLVNEELPATYTQPVRFNHCFARIGLDWLFQDCWYHHLNRRQTAMYQLSQEQLQQVIGRMELWLQNQQILVADNKMSLQYRSRLK